MDTRPQRRHEQAIRGGFTLISAAGLALLTAGCGSSSPAAIPGPQPVHISLRSEALISVLYNQGIARVAGGWVLSGSVTTISGLDSLVRTDDRFHVIAQSEPPLPPVWRARGYDHIGDIDVVAGVIYAPLEQPDYSKGYQADARYDATTLRFLGARVVHQHQNSFLAVDPRTKIAYSMDEFDGRSLLRYDTSHAWRRLGQLRLSQTLHDTQGASVRAGFIWISTSDPQNDIYRVDLSDGVAQWVGTQAHPGGEGEGIDATPLSTGQLHAMIIDPRNIGVWIENFAVLSGRPAGSGSS